MENIVVVEHHYEEDADVYRLVIGVEQAYERQVFDDNGPVMLPAEQLLGPDGEPLEIDGEPVMGQRPMTEQVKEVVPVESFLFAADDERWAGKKPKEVAAIQRQIVREALEQREQEATEPVAQPKALPGVGEAL